LLQDERTNHVSTLVFFNPINIEIMKSSNVLMSVIAGAAAGAVLGVLYAPDKGANTRNRIVRKGQGLVGGIKEKASHLAEMVTTPFYGELEAGNGRSTMPKTKLPELK
jgi:gas vesicle protein